MSVKLTIDELFPKVYKQRPWERLTGPMLRSPTPFWSLQPVRKMLATPCLYDALLESLAAQRDSVLWDTEAFRARFLATLKRMAPPGRPLKAPLARVRQRARCSCSGSLCKLVKMEEFNNNFK